MQENLPYPFRKKPKNELVAQGDAFIDEKISKMIPDLYRAQPEERMSYAGKLKAVGELLPYSKVLTPDVMEFTDDTHVPVFSDAIPVHIAKAAKEHWAEYVAFLKAEKKETILFRKECLDTYANKFKNVVQPILDRIHAIPGAIAVQMGNEAKEKVSQIPGYVETGTRGHVFKIEVGGVPYIMKKFFGDPKVMPVFVESDQVLAHQRSQGIPHTQQLVGYSHDDHTLILSYMNGKEIGNYKSGELDSLPKEHVRNLIDTCMALNDRGLLVDYHYDGGNFLYDKNEGVNFIDPTLSYQGENWSTWINQVRRTLSVRSDGGPKTINNELAKQLGEEMVSILKENYPGRLKEHPQVISALERRI